MELIHNIPNPTPFPVHELLISQSPNANGSVCTSALISPALQCPKQGLWAPRGCRGGPFLQPPKHQGSCFGSSGINPFLGAPLMSLCWLCVCHPEPSSHLMGLADPRGQPGDSDSSGTVTQPRDSSVSDTALAWLLGGQEGYRVPSLCGVQRVHQPWEGSLGWD